LDQAQQALVREFREHRRLLEDAAFAFHLSTYEEAKSAGSDFLAAAWARVRAMEEDKLLPDAAAALAEFINFLLQGSSGGHRLRQI
jgi:hypothetical protein